MTLARVDFTSASSVTGVTVIPAFLKIVVARTPHGTCAWHTATVTPLFARSASDVTLPGLLGGTAISPELLTKSVGVPATPASVTVFMLVGDAEANTSAGAPCVIWVARVELAAKLKVTVVPGCAAWNWVPSVVNEPVSDAAANTVIVPDRAGPDDDVDPDGAEDEAPESDELPDEHPASRTAASRATAVPGTRRADRRTGRNSSVGPVSVS